MDRGIAELLGRGVVIRKGHRLYSGVMETPSLHPQQVHLIIESCHNPADALELGDALGVDVNVHLSPEAGVTRKLLLNLLKAPARVGGLIVYGDSCERELASFREMGVPVVVFGERSPKSSDIVVDTGRRGEMAVEHLYGLGHRELAFIAPDPARNFPPMHREVEKAYEGACLKLGLKASADRLFTTQEAVKSMGGIWRTLLTEHREVTGVICEDIGIAAAIMAFAKADGRKVPSDLSVLCVHEHAQCRFHDIPMTSIEVDEREMLAMALLMIVKQGEAWSGLELVPPNGPWSMGRGWSSVTPRHPLPRARLKAGESGKTGKPIRFIPTAGSGPRTKKRGVSTWNARTRNPCRRLWESRRVPSHVWTFHITETGC
ncbi:MAG: LacI family transcriptional regulator [Candidatus Competibacteraceae bacterium]|nr:LacI family transcriptional regulator [Candidatus Competibacteraceae bacterium]